MTGLAPRQPTWAGKPSAALTCIETRNLFQALMLLPIQCCITVISDLLHCKEFIHKREINGFHLKTVFFKWPWWWWQQLIFHSAQNVSMHQLTNCTFPYIRYLICKNMQFLTHSVLEIQGRNLMPRNQLIWVWVFMGFLTADHNQSAFIFHVN